MHVVARCKVFFLCAGLEGAFVIYPIVHAVAGNATSGRYSLEPVFYVWIE